jgi:hypothetical protein
MKKALSKYNNPHATHPLGLLFFLCVLLCCFSCNGGNVNIKISKNVAKYPKIFPDYINVTIPPNIAPLNFSYIGQEESALIVEGKGGKTQIKGDDGLFSFSASAWKKLLDENKGGQLKLTVAVRRGNGWTAFKPFYYHIAAEDIDPWLSYRLLPPGHQAWYRMGIYQRNLENFDQSAIYENKLTNNNCINCHSYCKGNPDHMLFHSRADFGGTVMIIDDKPVKLNTKTDSTLSALVYPYWHPSGRYVAFSVNKTQQNFFNHDKNRIEVYDSASDVVVYDVQKHVIAYSPLTKSPKAFETFPTFSPDGKSLYFCSAAAVSPMPERYKEVKYNLCRIDFNPRNMTFGNKVDTIVNARKMGKSISFPRISPDGRYLAFTLHAYGNFSIWHRDADLYIVDLKTRAVYPLAEANSKDVDSYHSWSSNSRWLVFSSRRTNGLFTRPFITYIDRNGKAHKAFMLPQKNPLKYYEELMVSYNLPELMIRKATVSKHKIADALRNTDGTDVKVK